ncbi:MAG: 3-deoxy-D-manno-octulosonic acid transferase [Desulfobulbaceae bacterium]|nr:3-deoxy-D-manno-octulosonic acid transferase [Desulfobulbaceae bacterium]
MPVLYNALTLLLSPLALLLFLIALFRKKYRDRIPARLGFGLGQKLHHDIGTGTIWVHALSVGEVTSAQPLLRGISEALPAARLILSVGTRSGEQVARELLTDCCHSIVAAPYDLAPVIRYFIGQIDPRVFILVETDFWPNWLYLLANRGIPTYLVNGRISASSFTRYRRFAFFFTPMFRNFTALCMQTRADAANMEQLGLDPAHIHTLGNLKFDAAGYVADKASEPAHRHNLRQEYGFNPTAALFICGSTHAGEEEVLLPAYAALRRQIPQLQLLLAPRQVERTADIVELATRHGIVCRRRSQAGEESGPVLLLDTLGELASCYPMADLAFVGGSLVPAGGHNPVEAVAARVPVCFGPHMEDFSEIVAGLLESSGAVQLTADNLQVALLQLLQNAALQSHMVEAASHWLISQQGVVQRHLALIATHFQGESL